MNKNLLTLFQKVISKRYFLFFLLFYFNSSFGSTIDTIRVDTIHFEAKILIVDSSPYNAIDAFDTEARFLLLVCVKDTIQSDHQRRIVMQYDCLPNEMKFKEGISYLFAIEKIMLDHPIIKKEYKGVYKKEFVLREQNRTIYRIINYIEIK